MPRAWSRRISSSWCGLERAGGRDPTPARGPIRTAAEEVVEAVVSPGASEEVAVGGNGDLGEFAETKAFVNEADLGRKPQNGFFERFHELPPGLDWAGKELRRGLKVLSSD